MRRAPVLLVLLLVLAVVRAVLPPAVLPGLPALLPCALLAAFGLGWARAARRAPEDGPLRRDPGLGLLVVALAALLAVLQSHNYRLTSDGVDHFVYLRSLWVDGDLDLANDYARVSPRGASVDPPTPLGRAGNLHPVGPAVLWSPLYLLADLLARAAGLPADGDGPAYRNAAAVASLLWGWLGLVLLYDAARRQAGRWAALAASLGVGFGTFLYWYLAWAPTMAHAPAFFACALFVRLWLEPRLQGPRRAALLGAACGLVALTRWPNALVALLPLVEALPRLRRPREWPALAREALAFGAAALVAFSPQMLAWKALYGAWLTVPQGGAFLAGAPAVAGVLFSPHHGLFSWSPLLYLALPGFGPLFRGRPWAALGALAFAAALVRVNAGVADWWGGAAFGGRRFDALLPLFGLALACALAALARFSQRHPRTLPLLVLGGPLGWNLLLARQYESGAWDYAGPVAFEQMGHAAVSQVDRAVGSPFSLPASLYDWLRAGVPPAAWESLYTQRPYARWSVRMGLDERLFLEDGWSAPEVLEGTPARRLAGDSAGLVVPLHQPREARLGLRLRLAPGATAGSARLRLLVNQRVAGSVEAGPAWADAELAVPGDFWRPGRNAVRLRLLDEGTSVAVAGLWLEPAR